MGSAAVERLYEDYKDVVCVLDLQQQTSLRITAEDALRKALLMAAASYFEVQLVEAIASYVQERTRHSDCIESFVKNRALARRFHEMFDWEAGNANRFYSYFGPRFLSAMRGRSEKDAAFGEAARAFVALGAERNRLAHQDFGSMNLEKTADEIYDLYRKALRFVDLLPACLREMDGAPEPAPSEQANSGTC